MPCPPVTITQRASSSPTAAASASRIGWSRALRLPGLEIVNRATCSAGRSRTSLPSASSTGAEAASPSAEDKERVALVDCLALLAEHLLDGSGVLGLQRHLHLHGLEYDDRVALVDLVPDRDLDLPDDAGDVRLDVGHGRPPRVRVR